jgi:hypothetical protein
MQSLKIIFGGLVGYLMLDFVMFFVWVYSGQVAEGLYLGKITAEILKLII